MNKLGVLTSGGDSPGMNSAIRAVTKLAAAKGVPVVGVRDGYDGLIDGDFRGAHRHQGRRLGGGGRGGRRRRRPGRTFLGSARSARFREAAGRRAAVESMRREGVDGLVVIGGNGTLAGAHLLAQEHGVHLVGIPGSIDNDIGCTSSSLGVDTALNTIVDACDRISDTARAHRRAFVVEVMGRDCGYLAMASAVALAADAVLIREQGKTEEQLIEGVSAVIRLGYERGKRRILIIKAEGVHVPCTRLVRLTEERMRPSLPAVEIRATVLGHVVRGETRAMPTAPWPGVSAWPR